MKGREESPMSIKCPVCGIALRTELIPASRTASFLCPQCRTQLGVAAPNTATVAVTSILLSLVLCVAWGLTGQLFIPGVVGAAAVFYLLGRLVQTIAATPKIRKSQANYKMLRQATRSKPAS